MHDLEFFICAPYKAAMLQEKQQILEGCSRIVPSLRDAEVVADWAGLRPYRQRVRIELEHKQVLSAVEFVV